jgi:hypothetical protein
MESDWHVVSISLLDELVRNYLGAPTHYFCGGNMFLYYSIQQAKEIEEYVEAESVKTQAAFQGSRLFPCEGVWTEPSRATVGWCGTRMVGIPTWWWSLFPLPRARRMWSRNVKFYAQVFRVPEYFWFDRRSGELVGYRLVRGRVMCG